MTDNCPRCCRPGIRPAASRDRGTEIVHAYRCPRCRHTWTTSRRRDAYREAA